MVVWPREHLPASQRPELPNECYGGLADWWKLPFIAHARVREDQPAALKAGGRALEAAFEAAVAVSHRHGLWLLEMQALGDLKLHVLDKDGRGGEGTRRLKAVLQRMKGPAAELTKLLGDGLDAEEVLRS